MNEPSDVLLEIRNRLERIELDQKHMKSTFGAHIAGALQSQRLCAQSEPCHTTSHRTTSTPVQSWANKGSEQNVSRPPPVQQKISQGKDSHTSPVAKSSNTSSPPTTPEFKPQNTLVIYDFKVHAKSDREIRQLVNKTAHDAVVQNITR